jgi:hypothetical protein
MRLSPSNCSQFTANVKNWQPNHLNRRMMYNHHWSEESFPSHFEAVDRFPGVMHPGIQLNSRRSR